MSEWAGSAGARIAVIAFWTSFVSTTVMAVQTPMMGQWWWPPPPQPEYYPPPGYEQERPRFFRRRPNQPDQQGRRETEQKKQESSGRKSSPKKSSGTGKKSSSSDSKKSAASTQKSESIRKQDSRSTGVVETAYPLQGDPQQSNERQWLKDNSDVEPEAEPHIAGTANGIQSTSTATSMADFRSVEGYVTYVWDTSDSLSRLAKLCGTTTNQILEDNLMRMSEMRDGQVLRVPKPLQESPEIREWRNFAPEIQLSREVWRGVRGKKRVALTFDAGGEDDGVGNLIQHLTREQAKATFFVTGQFVEENPEYIKQISAAGFPIHNHSWSHPEFTKISERKMEDELSRTDAIFQETTGKSTQPYWRPPFGDRDDRVLRTAASAGYQSVYWTLDSLDSVGEPKSREFIVERIMNPPKSGNDPEKWLDGAIILMHVGKAETAEAVPDLIRELRARGFELVTVEEILLP